MMPPRIGHAIIVWLAIPVLLIPAGGCRKRLRPVEDIGQQLIDDEHAIWAQTEALELVVWPIEVPWADKTGPIGFRVELTNLTDQPLELGPTQFELQDALGRLLPPVPPQRLRGAFATPAATGTALRSAPADGSIYRLANYGKHRHYRTHRRHYYSHHYYPRRYRHHYYSGYYGGYWGYYGAGISIGWGYYDNCDPYDEARITSYFLSELLDDQTVDPNHIAVGNLVFAHRPERGELLTLLFHVPSGSSGDEPAALDFLFEVH